MPKGMGFLKQVDKDQFYLSCVLVGLVSIQNVFYPTFGKTSITPPSDLKYLKQLRVT